MFLSKCKLSIQSFNILLRILTRLSFSMLERYSSS
jgi:hypothetical protein